MECDSIMQVADFYNHNNDSLHKHKTLYESFHKNAENFNNRILETQFNNTPGFGELAFSWNWYLIVKDMPANFKFLEIGVYKGRVLAIIQLLSLLLNKQSCIFGITPLNISSDKYSQYDNVDYFKEIKKSFHTSNLPFDNTQIIEGYSQNKDVIEKASLYKEYDVIFIDGCHDYEIVCMDIQNYSTMLKVGGYLILDDASSLLEGAYGMFLGHHDVGKATKDIIDTDSRFVHLYAVGHNRVWKKIAM